MEIQTATVVDIGTSYEKNDDRALVDTVIYNEESGTQRIKAAVVVCDGVGGNAGGGYAANLILTELSSVDWSEINSSQSLIAVLQHVNEMLLGEQDILPQYSRMCTTIAGVVFQRCKMLIFHSGDSRIYRYDGTYLTKMTKDHSVVQEMIDRSVISEEEAANYGGRNQITRCLGRAASLPPEIYETRLPIQPGETILLCSDGLWDVVPDSQIREVLSEECTLGEKARVLVLLAKEQGSVDNITVCLCSVPDVKPKLVSTVPFILD